MHSSGWFYYLSHDDKQDKPAITRELLSFMGPPWKNLPQYDEKMKKLEKPAGFIRS
jgi:hypothetical protein